MNKPVLAEARTHRFAVGELVGLAHGFGYAQRTGAVYEITALLPSDRAHLQYRIRGAGEAFERVAAENQLTPQGMAPIIPPAAIPRTGIHAASARVRRGGRR